jgi:uncharacterized protein YihD (DUF1040 family)
MYMTMLKKFTAIIIVWNLKMKKTNNRKKLKGVCQQYIQEH